MSFGYISTYYIHPTIIYHSKARLTNSKFAKTNFFYTSGKKKCFIGGENKERQTFSGLSGRNFMRRLICQRGCAVEGVAARCAVRVSGGRYNIDPDCSFSNGVITILFELIRDSTRLLFGLRESQKSTVQKCPIWLLQAKWRCRVFRIRREVSEIVLRLL